MEKQDEIRKELFDYLQLELSKERIDIKAKDVRNMRAVQFSYCNQKIGIYQIGNFYKQGIRFEVTYYFDDYEGSIHSYDSHPIILYFMPEEVALEAEKRNEKYLKKVREAKVPPIFLALVKPQNPREKYIISQQEFEKKCFMAIKTKRNEYVEWLKYQALIYASLNSLPILKDGVSLEAV